MFRQLLPFVIWSCATAICSAQPDLVPPGPPANTLPGALSPPLNALPDQPVEQEGVEALTKGPIHEAFADPATPDPQASPIVAKAPPADVPEQPAAYKPEGDFIWIPGYWAWDDDRNDFLWVTGVWRQPPPGMRWVPGYWQEAAGGWQRVKGFWIQDQTQDVVYYNQPPASLEAGPSSPAPAPNYFWVPGSWTYPNANIGANFNAGTSANTGFAWQGGYWAPYQQNWVYAPARWTWTPAGYVYVPGYWDYRLGNRGQIFAPVYFRSPLYAQAGWSYRPSIVIPTGNLFIHLWMQPRYGSYFFGNYFGPQYANRGFVAWSNLPSQRLGFYYDPFYSYANVHYRQQGVDYLGRVQGWHNFYAQHPENRPPATFREQQEWLKTPAAAAASHDAQLVARPIGEIARQGDSPIKFTHLNEQALQSQAEHAKQIRELDTQRRNLEREHAQVSVDRPTPGAEQLREQAKTGSLVDRVERGDKAPLPRPLAGSEAAKATQTAKFTLPKMETPKIDNAAIRTPGDSAAAAGIRDRANAPPLPRADGAPRIGDRQNASSLPTNVISGAANSSSRSTFGAKTGEPSRFPGRSDDPRTQVREGSMRGGSDNNPGRTTVESPRELTTPSTITPPIGNRDRSGIRNDQPTFPGFGGRSGGGNANPTPPQPPRGPSRPEGGSPNDNSKKGKSRG